MTRDHIATFATTLLPLVLLALTALAGWAARIVGRHIRDRRLALAVELAAYGAAAVVADLAQHVVADLKDPSKPGTWSNVVAASVRLRAVAQVRALYPSAVRVLEQAATDPKRVDELLGTLVERAVVELKGRGVSGALLAETVVNVGGRLTVAPDESAPRVDEATTAGRAGVPTAVLGALVLALGAGCGPGATNAAAARNAVVVAWPAIHRGAREVGVCSDTAPCWVTGGEQPCAGPASSAAAGDGAVTR